MSRQMNPPLEPLQASTPAKTFIMRRVTRAEIEQQLIEIVRKEKDNIPADKLQPDTQLADAGIDSLDSLTILFAIEEHFSISIPDTAARAMKTFGDMVDTVAAELRIDS